MYWIFSGISDTECHVLDFLRFSDTERGVLEDDISSDSSDGESDHLSVNEESASSDCESDNEYETEQEEQNSTPSSDFKSKKGDITWHAQKSAVTVGRKSAKNVIDQVPGITRYAASRITDIPSAFELFVTPKLFNIILKITDKDADRVRYKGDIISLMELKIFRETNYTTTI